MENFLNNLLKIYSLCTILMTEKSYVNAVDSFVDTGNIVRSNCDPKVVASILPYRTQEHCAKINDAMEPSYSVKPLVDPNYYPVQNTKPYDDLVFALVKDPLVVFSRYLGHYLDTKDETYIIMIFIQIDDRVKFKDTYNKDHKKCFDDARKEQRHPFENALRVWAMDNRADGADDSCEQGTILVDEKGKWNEKCRDGLEAMLMKHTIKYAQNGISCYGKNQNPQPNLIADISGVIKNKDLIDLYTSLVRYIQNENDYLARLLHDHCDERDNFALWIVVLTTRRNVEAMEALDKAFRVAFNGLAMKDFVLKCTCQDTVFKDMLAALIDQSYRPSYMKPQDD